MLKKLVALALGLSLVVATAHAQDELSYRSISARHSQVRMTAAELELARAEGECLAGIKEIGSLPMDEFQPNIEWLNIRTQALLAMARPCEVLVMLEAAHDALGTTNAPSRAQ